MRRNALTLIVVNILFGLSFGLYELAFPLFLDDCGLRPQTIGLVLGAGAAVNFLVVVYGGRLADLVGRKSVYGWSLTALAAASAATPLVPHLAYLTVLKTLQQALTSLNRTIRGVLVYESVALERFTRVYGQVVGWETSAHALGFLCVGFVGMGPAAALSYRGLFLISGLALGAGAVVFFGLFTDRAPARPVETVRLTLRDLVALDLHRKLYLIIAAGFIIGAGFGVSHTLWQIYFRRQLDGPWAGDLEAFQAHLRSAWPALASVWTGSEGGASFALISLIAVAHRLMMGVPMLMAAPLLRRGLKGLFVLTMALQGVAILAPGVADWLDGGFLAVAALWVIHDMVGASIWVPIQERFIQDYSRPERRGADSAKAKALMALGWVVGTVLAGPCMEVQPALPFFVGGAMIAVGSLVLLAL